MRATRMVNKKTTTETEPFGLNHCKIGTETERRRKTLLTNRYSVKCGEKEKKNFNNKHLNKTFFMHILVRPIHNEQ